MKTLILLTALISSFAFAKTVAQVSPVDNQIQAVQLSDAGVLTVIKADGSETSIELAESNKQSLLSEVQMLTNAKITTDVHAMVCMMMLSFPSQNLYVLNENTDALRLVLSTSSCALHEYTHPQDSYLLDTAHALKIQMSTFAHQLVQD